MAGRETATGGEVAGGRARRDGAGDPGGARRGDGRAGEERACSADRTGPCPRATLQQRPWGNPSRESCISNGATNFTSIV